MKKSTLLNLVFYLLIVCAPTKMQGSLAIPEVIELSDNDHFKMTSNNVIFLGIKQDNDLREYTEKCFYQYENDKYIIKILPKFPPIMNISRKNKSDDQFTLNNDEISSIINNLIPKTFFLTHNCKTNTPPTKKRFLNSMSFSFSNIVTAEQNSIDVTMSETNVKNNVSFIPMFNEYIYAQFKQPIDQTSHNSISIKTPYLYSLDEGHGEKTVKITVNKKFDVQYIGLSDQYKYEECLCFNMILFCKLKRETFANHNAFIYSIEIYRYILDPKKHYIKISNHKIAQLFFEDPNENSKSQLEIIELQKNINIIFSKTDKDNNKRIFLLNYDDRSVPFYSRIENALIKNNLNLILYRIYHNNTNANFKNSSWFKTKKHIAEPTQQSRKRQNDPPAEEPKSDKKSVEEDITPDYFFDKLSHHQQHEIKPKPSLFISACMKKAETLQQQQDLQKKEAVKLSTILKQRVLRYTFNIIGICLLLFVAYFGYVKIHAQQCVY